MVPNTVLGVFVMAVFKVANPRVFYLLGSEKYNPGEAREFCTSLLGRSKAGI
ncbi:hypothetical protein OMCYN_01799 [cyanobiont of Ornithocercus magnificus]|nr:hypothetical protein OMCYN_01799 [cyanobiont of Ornithocercus magnificus]